MLENCLSTKAQTMQQKQITYSEMPFSTLFNFRTTYSFKWNCQNFDNSKQNEHKICNCAQNKNLKTRSAKTKKPLVKHKTITEKKYIS